MKFGYIFVEQLNFLSPFQKGHKKTICFILLYFEQTEIIRSDEILDGIVEGLMRELPNCGYKRMNGLLLDAGHRIQQNCIRECMRRVNPEGVLLRALELRTVCRRR